LLEQALGEQLRRYDKGGEQFYDTISALHKAVRGSDPGRVAVLVRAHDRRRRRPALRGAPAWCGWRARTSAWPIRGRFASRSTPPRPTSGSARPRASWPLAEAVVYLAMAPKSNAVYAAFNAARAFVKSDRTRPVPLRLRNAPTSLMKSLEYGKGYRYAHDEAGAFAAGERYWPDDLEPPRFYEPVERGLEIRIGERLAELRA
jgi:putative ATPase